MLAFVPPRLPAAVKTPGLMGLMAHSVVHEDLGVLQGSIMSLRVLAKVRVFGWLCAWWVGCLGPVFWACFLGLLVGVLGCLFHVSQSEGQAILSHTPPSIHPPHPAINQIHPTPTPPHHPTPTPPATRRWARPCLGRSSSTSSARASSSGGAPGSQVGK